LRFHKANKPKAVDGTAFHWCFIGTGTLANCVAKSILPSGGHTIAAAYTRRFEKCLAFSNKYGATPYRSARDAICAPGVDAVYIVTPHNSHYEYAKLALSLGKPVLCEKPFTVTAKQAEELIALAAESHLYIAEAMWTWFAPVANKIKAWLDNGEFGEVKSVLACYHWKIRKHHSRHTNPDTAGGALLDIGIYPITYLYRLFGCPVKTVCTGELKDGIDLCEDVAMTFENGQTYTATSSIKDSRGSEKLIIKGSDAKITVRVFRAANAVRLIRKNKKNERFSGNGWYLNEFDIVASEIREGLMESRFVPHGSTLDVMRIIDDCRHQLGLIYPFEASSDI